MDWSGPDVWFAHAVHIQEAEIERMGRAGIGVAHCPSSNMRLASGIAPIRRYLAAGVKVGLGVDGSGSNDSSHLVAEGRPGGVALEVARRGGAAVLGREDIGSLEPGKCADFIALDLNRLDYAGAWHDPVAAVVLCAPAGVDRS